LRQSREAMYKITAASLGNRELGENPRKIGRNRRSWSKSVLCAGQHALVGKRRHPELGIEFCAGQLSTRE
jgi:hypothetical protein